MTRKPRYYRAGVRNGGPFSIAGLLILSLIVIATWGLHRYGHLTVIEAVPVSLGIMFVLGMTVMLRR